MNITGATGLTPAQVATLKAVGGSGGNWIKLLKSAAQLHSHSVLLVWLDRSSFLCDNSRMNMQERRLELFVSANGKAPFEEWMRSLRDKATKARIFSRIDRLRMSNFGDCEPVGDGVFELRIHFGPGFRVYFGIVGDQLVLLLCGGDKRSQNRDIAAAIRYWKEYKSRVNEKL